MRTFSTIATALPPTTFRAVDKAWDEVSVSFDRFCLAAGIEALGTMMEKDAEEACGRRHVRSEGRRGHRWGHTQGKISFHAGKVDVERPRVRGLDGKELALPSWEQAVEEDWLGRWAMNLMLVNVSTRKFRRAVRLPEHASVRRALRQAWEHDDADKAEKLLRNLAQRLERDAPGVSKSILEGLDEILTVTRLGLPAELRRSLACTNIIENMMGTVRRVSRNVKRWSSASMALRWTAAAMLEAKKGFRRLKAYKQLPALRVALNVHYERTSNKESLAQHAKAA